MNERLYGCVNLHRLNLPEKTAFELTSEGLAFCAICDGYHDPRWHQAVWRRQAYEESPVQVAVYKRL